jgi:zinc transporter ZupT
MTWAGRFLNPVTVAAFAFGIFLWFFVDTIQGSSDLLVNSGFGGGLPQVAVVLLFALGVLLLFQIDRSIFSPQGAAITTMVPFIAALALGIHGLGEGSAFGSTASQSSSSSILDAFGGTSAGVAYALHKMLEPMMAAALYVSYRRGTQVSFSTSVRDIIVITLLFILPSVLGATTGYYLTYDATYFFALGTGTAVYVAARLLRQVYAGPTGDSMQSIKVGIAISVGFILIYTAALLHS